MIAQLISGSQAKDYYYEKDPIFTPEGKAENAEWYGTALVNDFLLPERLSKEHFERLIFGLDPNSGERLVQGKITTNSKGESREEHRAGIDFNFAPPKSVSIAALHMNTDAQNQIIECHKRAVDTALNYMEKNCIYYRDTIGEKTVKIQSDKMYAVKFMHSTSRENDPQLHTHAIILNMVKDDNGGYKALSNEELIQKQGLIGSIYQNELACLLQKECGLALDNYTSKFEIRGINATAGKTFEKRSISIKEWCEENRAKYPELSDAELKKKANLETRRNKDSNLTAEKLRNEWNNQLPREKLQAVTIDKNKEVITPGNIISQALSQIHKTEATFERSLLLQTALKLNRGRFTLQETEDRLTLAESKGEIIQMGIFKKRDNFGKAEPVVHYSSPAMIKLEKEISEAVKSVKGKDNPLMEIADAEKYIYGDTTLTTDQQEFLRQILISRDGIIITQGDAGTGKTYAVKKLRTVLDEVSPDTKIIGLGFTGKAAQELANAANIETSTIASFLKKKEQPEESTEKDKTQHQRILLVDEASMISSEDMISVIKSAGDDRIVFVGDGKQLQAIGAGKMFKDLQKDNQTILLEKSLRQKTPELKKMVNYIKNYQVGKNKHGIKNAVALMEQEGMLQEISKKTDKEDGLIEKAVSEYTSDSIVITTGRAMKDLLNEKIRENELPKEALEQSSKFKVKDSSYSSFLANDYKIGDKVNLMSKEYTIANIDSDKNSVTIGRLVGRAKKPDYRTIFLHEQNIEAVKEIEKEFTVGEKIVFTRNDKKLGVQNGLNGEITKIDYNGNVFVKADGRYISFNIKEYNNIDYGYAQTVIKSQGQTAKKAIYVHNKSDNLNTEAFYVAATRATHEFVLITNDKEKLLYKASQEQVKTSTRDFTKETKPETPKSKEYEETQVNTAKRNEIEHD